MPAKHPHGRELGYYFTVAQVGLEMVVPIGVGLLLDNTLGWAPWGVVVGAVLGLATGLTHLVALSNRRHPGEQDGAPGEKP
jgi:F0F1-type ATP synthase assembly protein I